MRTSQKADRSRLMAAALGQIPCDLTVENVQLVNMFTGEIYPASVDVLDGTVVRVRTADQPAETPAAESYDGGGAYLIPGFIDTHVHVESTMMIPQNLGRAIVPLGTTTVCTDPHEIGNVMGIGGVKFMLEDGKKSALRHYVLAPSCIPSVPGMESTGAVFGAAEVGALLDMPDVVGVAEVMDFVNVIKDDARMHSIVDEGLKRGVYVQAHAPYVTGKQLAAYILGGPKGDHESNTAAEVSEKLRSGMHVNLRASSLVNALPELLQGFKDHKWRDQVSICTDDVHAKDLLSTGHINHVVRGAIAGGMDPVEVIKFATLNAAREYGFDNLGAIAPGYLADMQLVRKLDGGTPEAVFIMGRLAAKNGAYVAEDTMGEEPAFPNTVNIPQIASAEDFVLKAPAGCGDTALVAALKPNGIILNELEWIELPVVNGAVSLGGHDDLCFACVANRYGSGGKTVAVLKGRALKNGAYGTTISHDCHNMTILYKDPADALAAAQALQQAGGGICVVQNGAVTSTLPLPVAGLMSTLPIVPLSEAITNTEAAVQAICGEGTSLLHASLLALACLPGFVISDFGIVDGLNQQIVPVVKPV